MFCMCINESGMKILKKIEKKSKSLKSNQILYSNKIWIKPYIFLCTLNINVEDKLLEINKSWTYCCISSLFIIRKY